MRVLLTGSSGWLGRHVAPLLRERGDAVVGLDVSPGPDTTVVGSIAHRDVVRSTITDHGIDAVIHAAALHKPDIAHHPASRFVDVNVAGTLHLLEAAADAGHDRFVFTSTTSLMISAAIRAEADPTTAVWLDRDFGPLQPRNIYGVTKLAAENLCRLMHEERALACAVLRTGRFFPEEDDQAHRQATIGVNTKANELLYRRLTVDDAARAHLAALDRAPDVGFGVYVLAAPTPFQRADAAALRRDAAAVIRARFPDVDALYAARGWTLPKTIGRVYDARHAETELGFRCRTDFAELLAALRANAPLPFAHDPDWITGTAPGLFA
ncbi:MAG: NAD(P)-dependent oxidoreductase [Planctomycetota bacterium]